MTSSPEPRPFTLPDLTGPAAAHRAGRRPATSGRADPATSGASWALPELAARRPGLEGFATASHTPEDEAYALGLAEGLRQGEARAAEDLRPALEALVRLAEQVEVSQERFERDRERNLRGLALAVANRLMQREVTADPGWVRDLVMHAIELMPASAPLEVRLSPIDLAAIGPELEKLSSAGRSIPIQWLPEPSLERGSFVIEGPLRIVDGRTDTALRTLFERLDHD